MVANKRVSEEAMAQQVEAGVRSVATFREDMDHFQKEQEDINRIQPSQ